jgi:hypothetical protein
MGSMGVFTVIGGYLRVKMGIFIKIEVFIRKKGLYGRSEGV